MTEIKPTILAGFMELVPEDQIVFDAIKASIAETFANNAFKSIETPIIEKKEILLAKGGGETSKQIYDIDHESRDMSLRFDLTVPLARYVSQHYHELNFPFRRYQIGKVYRGERNQKGRYKEFYQCDIDIVGDSQLNIRNDAEIPYVIYQAFSNINLENITFNMNNRKLLSGFLESLSLNNYIEILRIIDKKDKVDSDKFRDMLKEEIPNDSSLDKVLNFLSFEGSNEDTISFLRSIDSDNDKFLAGIDELELVYKYMKEFGIAESAIKINLSISRGLDYYTGTVFETFLDGYESIGSISSGGRYDDLASNFTKQKLPGVGMSIGLTRLFYQLNQADLINISTRPYCDVLVVPMSQTHEYAMDVLNKLRANKIRSQIYFEDHKFKKIFSFADKENIKYVVIVGEDEIKNNNISLKNMENGKQESIVLDKAIEIINNN